RQIAERARVVQLHQFAAGDLSDGERKALGGLPFPQDRLGSFALEGADHAGTRRMILKVSYRDTIGKPAGRIAKLDVACHRRAIPVAHALTRSEPRRISDSQVLRGAPTARTSGRRERVGSAAVHAFFCFFSAGSFAALRSAALMRLCQPRPLRRKCAMTSRSSRRLIKSFVTSAFGRPRDTGTPPMWIVACLNHSSVNSGISS